MYGNSQEESEGEVTWVIVALEILKALGPVLGPILEKWFKNRIETIADEAGEVSADPAEFKAQLGSIFSHDSFAIRRPRHRRIARAVQRIVLAHADEIYAHVKPMLTRPPLQLAVRPEEVAEAQNAAVEGDE
jgi:hypothetical protein